MENLSSWTPDGWMKQSGISKLDASVSSNIWIDWKKLKFLNVSFAITDIF